MKKKDEKTLILKDSELYKAKVSIIEANQTQQTVVIRFIEDSNLSDYYIAVCKVSPLLNSPERVAKILAEFRDSNIEKDQKAYITFCKEENAEYIVEDDAVIIKVYSARPFKLKDDEVIGLLEKENNSEVIKIIDWAKPIIDEPIPGEVIEKLQKIASQKPAQADEQTKEQEPKPVEEMKTTEDGDSPFYHKRKEEKTIPIDVKKTPSNWPLLWFILIILFISTMEIISVIDLGDVLVNNLQKAGIIPIKNLYFGILFSKWLNLEKKNLKIGILLLFSLIFITISAMLNGIYLSFLSVIILGLAALFFAKNIGKLGKFY